jgi:hypothetical protein
MFWAMISKKGGNAPRATDLRREETNPPQASVLHIGTQYLLYRTDSTADSLRVSVVVGTFLV